ncbi:MAG: hypothetical protein IKS32_08400 [Solobacterium sp.]|nr:hypothetical protein [Solobacterium sp.]
MKYNYCPVCGEKLPPHHFGKLCKNCAKKEFTKKAVGTVVAVGITAAVGAGVYYYVKHHKKEVAGAAAALATKALELELHKLAEEPKIMLDLAKQVYRAKEKIPA